MAMTELDCAALGEMSGKYLTSTHKQTSRIAKEIDFPGLTFPVSPPSPIPATSAGISVMDWLAGYISLSLVVYLPSNLCNAHDCFSYLVVFSPEMSSDSPESLNHRDLPLFF